MRVLNDLPLADAEMLRGLRNADETWVLTGPDEEGDYTLTILDQVGEEQAWGKGGSPFDAALRAVLVLCPDLIVDYPEYEEDYRDE